MAHLKEGDLVTLNKEIPNKPIMMVYSVKRDQIPKDPTTPFCKLIGIECIWFTSVGNMEKGVFNFKDLISLEDE